MCESVHYKKEFFALHANVDRALSVLYRIRMIVGSSVANLLLGWLVLGYHRGLTRTNE